MLQRLCGAGRRCTKTAGMRKPIVKSLSLSLSLSLLLEERILHYLTRVQVPIVVFYQLVRKSLLRPDCLYITEEVETQEALLVMDKLQSVLRRGVERYLTCHAVLLPRPTLLR